MSLDRVCRKILDNFGNDPYLVLKIDNQEELGCLNSRGSKIFELELILERQSVDRLRKDIDEKYGPFAPCSVVLICPKTDICDVTVTKLMQVISDFTKSNFLIVLTAADGPSEPASLRKLWENNAIECGFRKHPSYFEFNDYQALQVDGYPILIPLQVVPQIAQLSYPLSVLKLERDLHMDMLRESGSRSDAHIIRYVLASKYIRPGDRVLDAACGLGYGSYLLHQLSAASIVNGIDSSKFSIEYASLNYSLDDKIVFEEGELPECLHSFPDASFDVVVSFETLEHLEGAADLLHEFQRVLTPGGRIIASVPNDWTDQTGLDPNPFHLQSYNFAKFAEEISSYFTMEAMVAQTADRAKRHDGLPGEFVARSRKIEHINFRLGEGKLESEWLIAIASKDLTAHPGADYVERIFTPDEVHSSGNALAIKRDYDNPWLLKSLISIGYRVEDNVARRLLAEDVLEISRAESADFGAMLCVLGYISLEENKKLNDEDFRALIKQYIEIVKPENSTVLRWQISLTYLLAVEALHRNDHEVAKDYFHKVIQLGPEKYNVTLLTKSADAAFKLGCIYLAEKNSMQAVEIWRENYVKIMGHLSNNLKMISDKFPAPFVLNEISDIFALLGRIAGAMRYAAEISHRPKVFSFQIERDHLSQIDILKNHINDADSARDFAFAQVEVLRDMLTEKDLWNRDLSTGKDWCESQWKAAECEIHKLKDLVEEQRQWILQLTEAKDWLESQLKLS